MSTPETNSARIPPAGSASAGKGSGDKNRRPARRPSGPRGLWLFWLSLLMMVAVLAAAAYSLYWGYGVYQGDRILPGVHVWGVNLGGQTTAQATATLVEEWASREIVLQDGDQTWSLAPEKLGVLFDAEATVRAAHGEFRREGDPDQPRQVVRQLIAGTVSQVPSVQRIVRSMIRRWPPRSEWRWRRLALTKPRRQESLRTLAGQIEVLPQEAAVRVVEGRVVGSPSSGGRALDISAALSMMERLAERIALTPAAQVDAVPAETVYLPIVPLEPIVRDVSEVVEEASRFLANSLSVALYDAVTDERFAWTLTPEMTSNWLSFKTDAKDPSKVQLSVDEAKVAETLKEQEGQLGGGRYVDKQLAVPALVEAFTGSNSEVRQRLYHYAKTHTVKSGETLSSIGFDYGMPYPGSWRQIPAWTRKWSKAADQIPSQDNLLPLPVVENKRIKVSISEQKVQAFEDGELKWDWPASTGIKSSPTNPGVFQIQSHDPNAYAARWDLWMPQFMGIYRPVPSVDFMNGFHGFPSRDQRQILWTKNLGSQITYGCIMVSTDNAKLLFDWADDGVVVEITP
jgi:lipoprotein-anchoring transpeptidase ErfK/SrfK